MSDAPERIWMDMRPEHLKLNRQFVTQGLLAAPPYTEYVRADALAAKDAEIERLRARIAEKDEVLAHFYSGDGLDEAALLIQSILHPLKAQHDPDHAVQVGIRTLIDRVRARKALEG